MKGEQLSKIKRLLIDKDDYFSSMSEEDLFKFWVAYYPSGSGPLAMMGTVCRLIEAVAKLRGFDVTKWPSRAEVLA